jgi:hypothetical protein
MGQNAFFFSISLAFFYRHPSLSQIIWSWLLWRFWFFFLSKCSNWNPTFAGFDMVRLSTWTPLLFFLFIFPFWLWFDVYKRQQKAYIYVCVYVWKWNTTMLELDFWSDKYLEFELIPLIHCSTNRLALWQAPYTTWPHALYKYCWQCTQQSFEYSNTIQHGHIDSLRRLSTDFYNKTLHWHQERQHKG